MRSLRSKDGGPKQGTDECLASNLTVVIKSLQFSLEYLMYKKRTIVLLTQRKLTNIHGKWSRRSSGTALRRVMSLSKMRITPRDDRGFGDLASGE